ncbi:MAG: hypothetical protein LBJ93_03035 [Clostridiales bacterium]|jgi:hypothetical protein|nr:hypothetical protein [Clostridiales bacterium]
MNLDTRNKIEHAINRIYDHKREKIEKISKNDIVTIEANGCNVAIKVDTQEPIERAVLIIFEIIEDRKNFGSPFMKLYESSAVFTYLINYIILAAQQKQQDEFYSDLNVKYIMSLLKFLKTHPLYSLFPLYLRFPKIESNIFTEKEREELSISSMKCYLTFEEETVLELEKVIDRIINILVKDNNFEQVKKIGIKDDSIQFVSSPIADFFKDPIKPQLKRNMFIAISSPLIGSSVTVILLGSFNHLFTNFAINLAAIDMLKLLPAALGLILCVIFVIKLTINKFSRDEAAREENLNRKVPELS